MVAAKGNVLANHEIVTIAVYMLDGHMRRVDTEDIAMKANELVPGRFAWRKYPEQVNLDAVRKRLWDARNPKKGEFLLGSEKDGWSLTDVGRKFAEQNLARLDVQSDRQPLTLREQQWKRNERERLIGTRAFEAYETGRLAELSMRDAEVFFRVDENTSPEMVKQRVERTLMFFRSDPLLGELVLELVSRLEDEVASNE